MSQQEADFFASAKSPGGALAAPGTPTADDQNAQYAAFLAWQAAQAQSGAAPGTLSEEDYEFKVGHLVRLGTGYGIVVGRAPVSTSPTSGRNDGYIVAALGPANDTPVSAEQIGLTSL